MKYMLEMTSESGDHEVEWLEQLPSRELLKGLLITCWGGDPVWPEEYGPEPELRWDGGPGWVSMDGVASGELHEVPE